MIDTVGRAWGDAIVCLGWGCWCFVALRRVSARQPSNFFYAKEVTKKTTNTSPFEEWRFKPGSGWSHWIGLVGSSSLTVSVRWVFLLAVDGI